MAVPKKRTSKQKTRSRKATWNRKANIQAERALTLGKSLLTQKNTGFYYPTVEEGEDDTEE